MATVIEPSPLKHQEIFENPDHARIADDAIASGFSINEIAYCINPQEPPSSHLVRRYILETGKSELYSHARRKFSEVFAQAFRDNVAYRTRLESARRADMLRASYQDIVDKVEQAPEELRSACYKAVDYMLSRKNKRRIHTPFEKLVTIYYLGEQGLKPEEIGKAVGLPGYSIRHFMVELLAFYKATW